MHIDMQVTIDELRNELRDERIRLGRWMRLINLIPEENEDEIFNKMETSVKVATAFAYNKAREVETATS